VQTIQQSNAQGYVSITANVSNRNYVNLIEVNRLPKQSTNYVQKFDDYFYYAI